MFLVIIGLAIFFIATFFIYETAKKNGYNAAIWTALAVCAFPGIYLFLITVFGIIISIGNSQSVWTMDGVLYVGEIIHLVILGLSIGGVMLILLRVSQKKDKVAFPQPPLPPTFKDDN